MGKEYVITCLYLILVLWLQKARAEGHFHKLSGRGKEIARQSDEGNPFIAREEFLMNRIVMRNGAAPPWVEMQGGKFISLF